MITIPKTAVNADFNGFKADLCLSGTMINIE